MILLALLLIILPNANANSTENSVISAFKKTESVQKKFLQDTMKNRQQMEEFEENEFVPAVKTMIHLLDKKRCSSCLPSYLKGLTFLDGSADETLTDQLKQIIEKKPELLTKACVNMTNSTRKILKTRFKDALHFIAEEKKVDQLKIETSISKCL